VALLRCDFYSDVLGLSTSMTVILPQWTASQVGVAGIARTAGHPTLYLLHGRSDDDTAWLRQTSIERYVAPLGLAVVMPQVHLSLYADETHGLRFWTFLSAELPAIVNSFFNLSRNREDTFVAGLSMGGYGALKWALRQPDRFAAAASLSGALDMADPERARQQPQLMDRVFGDQRVKDSPNDLLWLLDQIRRTVPLPRLYVCCGTEDHLIGSNRKFLHAAASAGIPVAVDLGEGRHDWVYWDRKIQDVLRWLPLWSP
jgi:putative tributyrin esterase